MRTFNIVYQPYTLGDILFLQKFANVYTHITKDVVYWPVHPSLDHIRPYLENAGVQYRMPTNEFPSHAFLNTFLDYLKDVKIKSFNNPDLKYNLFPKVNTNVNGDDYNIFPVGLTHEISVYKQQHMKYLMYGITHDGWQTSLRNNLRRNIQKEEELFELVTKGKNKKYTFISPFFSSNSVELTELCQLDYTHEIEDRNGYCLYDKKTLDRYTKNNKMIIMDFIPGYSMFDWGKVIENATQIFAIESAICYYIEVLNTDKCDCKILYSRWKNKDYGFGLIEGLFQKNWDKQY